MDMNLLFIGLFVLMSIVDAIGRKKKREQQEEAERREREVEALERKTRRPTRSADPRVGVPRPSESRTALPPELEGRGGMDGRAGVEDWEWEGRGRPSPSSPPESAPQPPAAEPERVTADAMIPDELWNILTGGAPRPQPTSRPAPKPPEGKPGSPIESKREGARGPQSRPQPPQPPQRPGRVGTRPAKAGPEPRRPGAGPRSGTPSGPGKGAARGGTPPARPMDPTELPWRSESDRRPEEIGREGGTLVTPLRGEIGGPLEIIRLGRERSSSSPYFQELRKGGKEALRRAIVLQEVFGPPAALRSPEKRLWEAWEE